MSHTYSNLLYHCVFSTKNRLNVLAPDVRERLWPYMGGIVRDHNWRALCIGGTGDHVHTLLLLPAKVPIADAMKVIKAASSKWLSETLPGMERFAWQEGYGAFSVSISHRDDTIAYIKRQEEHHRHKTFKEEFVEFLRRHEIEWDERYIWD
ncbi:MAG: IS200/IS605 family transposase [bacterium]|nr:IS200/IS605 family transposase [bacterium]